MMVAYSVLQVKTTEEHRLAVTIHLIDDESSVIPRGAFIKNPHGFVQVNRCFEGKVLLFVSFYSWMTVEVPC